MSLRLDWCSYQAAKYAVEHWHYSRKMPVGKTVRVVVWERGRFIGAVIFACGSAGVGSMAKRFGLQVTEVAELARVALTSHESTVTGVMKVALRMLRKGCPRLRLVVSYADPEQGHIGLIYQAGNWIYAGRSAKDTAYIDANGRKWHSRSVSERGYKVHKGRASRTPRLSSMQPVEVTPKYRYLYPLDKDMRQRIAPLAKPYPKRAKDSSEPLSEPAERGRGSTDPHAPVKTAIT